MMANRKELEQETLFVQLPYDGVDQVWISIKLILDQIIQHLEQEEN